jgi:two-component system OmpR family response regulator
MSILIVDDQPDFRMMLTAFLEDAGYTIECAGNGRDALAHLMRCSDLPGLILLDVAMPIMTGWDFLRAQQSNAALRSIPVVVLSARNNAEHEAATYAPVAYLDKPVDLTTLLATIRAHYSANIASSA